ncbi:MAG: DoxX family protein [Crocinitomicaceae bacterium]
MKSFKIIYYASTGLLSAMMLMSASMYFFDNATITEAFTSLGFPLYLIYPIAIAKILGVIALWIPNKPTLKEWAYAGFFFEFTLALSAHLNINDGQFGAAALALILLFASYFTYQKLTNTNS